MVKTLSTMKLNLGDKAPDFTLLEPAKNKLFSLKENVAEKGYLIIFLCNHCPYVLHIAKELSKATKTFSQEGILVVGINSNDVKSHPEDSPDKMIKEIARQDYSFPYLFDENQEVAKQYQAACTPDFFLFDENKKLVYRGQFDDSRPGNEIAVTGKDLQQAVDHLIKKLPPLNKQKPSLGCNIKWQAGNEPTYF